MHVARMSLRLVLAWLHLLALGIGLAAVWGRARGLRASLIEPQDPAAIKRALTADTWWGIAAGLWLITGLWRLIGGTEKSTSYYLTNHLFFAKMGMFVIVLAIEIWPMVTLIRWRTGKAQPNPRDVGRIEVISYLECALVAAMVLAAVSMARGYGMPTARSAAGIIADSLRGLGDPPKDVDTTGATRVTSAASPTAAPVSSPPGATTTPTDADLHIFSGELAMPIAGIDPAKLHSNFDELRGGTRRHEALDIMSPRGTPIMSAAKGRVLKLFTSKAGGLMVYAADSSQQFILMYAHLDHYEPGLSDGAPLERGQVIGYVGFTGNAIASAPHLHLAFAKSADIKKWWLGTPIDPLPLLRTAAANRSSP
jgi:uncharacterized membrane protein